MLMVVKWSGYQSLNDSDSTEKILAKVSVDHFCDQIMKNNDTEKKDPLSFNERIELYSNCYLNDEKLVFLLVFIVQNAKFGQLRMRKLKEK